MERYFTYDNLTSVECYLITTISPAWWGISPMTILPVWRGTSCSHRLWRWTSTTAARRRRCVTSCRQQRRACWRCWPSTETSWWGCASPHGSCPCSASEVYRHTATSIWSAKSIYTSPHPNPTPKQHTCQFENVKLKRRKKNICKITFCLFPKHITDSLTGETEVCVRLCTRDKNSKIIQMRTEIM